MCRTRRHDRFLCLSSDEKCSVRTASLCCLGPWFCLALGATISVVALTGKAGWAVPQHGKAWVVENWQPAVCNVTAMNMRSIQYCGSSHDDDDDDVHRSSRRSRHAQQEDQRVAAQFPQVAGSFQRFLGSALDSGDEVEHERSLRSSSCGCTENCAWLPALECRSLLRSTR